MKSYRILKIRRPLSQLPEEERRALVDTLKRAEALGNLWSRGYEVVPPGMEYFAREFKWFKREVAKQGHHNKRWLRHIHAVFNCQIRLNDERDMGMGVLIDLPKGELRIRKVIKRKAVVIKLKEKEVDYIRQRLEEGAVLAFARAWVRDGYLYVALAFRREVEQYQPRSLIAVDINALHHGVAVRLVDGELKVEKYEAPINKIYKALEQARIWSALRSRGARRREKAFKKKAYNLVRHFVNETAHEIVELALSNQAEVWIDVPFDKSVRELYRKMPRAEKMLLAGMRRLARRVEELATWYGVPVRRITLYSTRCPICNAEMEELNGRMMRCPHCGFSAERDYVPLYWARRLWAERRAQSPSFPSPLIARQLYA